MITKLVLENFKSYRSLDLTVNPLTLLVGTNASGKSNIRDALRFLHAVGRGYSLEECLNGSWGEGGHRVWDGIRGGAEEACRKGRLNVGRQSYPNRPKNWPKEGAGIEVILEDEPGKSLTYRITIDCNQGVRLFGERLIDDQLPRAAFDTHPEKKKLKPNRGGLIWTSYFNEKQGRDPQIPFPNTRPILTQLLSSTETGPKLRKSIERVRAHLAGIRFLDLIPDRMRDYARREASTLGDHGENLSAILHGLLSKSNNRNKMRQELLDWLNELTPAEVQDIGFYDSPTGEVLFKIIEPNEKEISARSASDGTLRYLALAAALLSSQAGQTFFIEEIENGVHPTRLHRLVDMLEQMTGPGRAQVIASTHSPLTLAYLGESARRGALYCFRDEELGLSHATPVLALPNIEKALQVEPIDRLLTTGWMEHHA